MPLDDFGMRRTGLGFVYRITPVLVATMLYGLYFATLILAIRGLMSRSLTNRVNCLILAVLLVLFALTSAIWSLEVAQLFALDGVLLYPNNLSTDEKFKKLYAVIAHESSMTAVLFETQMIIGDILVIWRAAAIWHERRVVMVLPLFFWGLMIVNMVLHASFCRSGTSNYAYGILCKVTDIAAPTLSILVNVSVMMLTIWKAWVLREMLLPAYRSRRKDKLFSLFVLLIESGTFYVVMLVADMLITSFVTGSPESIGRMVSCISGYSTVQFVGLYPTLMLVILRRSIWNSDDTEVISDGPSNGISTNFHPERRLPTTHRSSPRTAVFPREKASPKSDLESVGTWHAAPHHSYGFDDTLNITMGSVETHDPDDTSKKEMKPAYRVSYPQIGTLNLGSDLDLPQ